MPSFIVTIEEVRRYELPVEAATAAAARAAAFKLWRDAPTIADYEVDDPDTEIIDVTPHPF